MSRYSIRHMLNSQSQGLPAGFQSALALLSCAVMIQFNRRTEEAPDD